MWFMQSKLVLIGWMIILCQSQNGIAAEPKLLREFDDNHWVRAISPDEKTIAIGRWMGDEEKVRALANKNPRKELFHGELILVDLASGKCKLSIKSVNWKDKGLHGSPMKAVFSPDGKMLAVVNSGTRLIDRPSPGHVTIFDARTGKVIHELDCREFQVQSLVFSPDSKMLVTSSGTAVKLPTGKWKHGAIIMFWDVSTGKLTKNISKKDFDIADHLSFSLDGRKLLIGFQFGTYIATVNQMPSAKTVFALPNDKRFSGGAAVMLSPDGSQLLVADFGNRLSEPRLITVWKLSSKELLATIKCETSVFAATFSHDGRFLLSLTFRGRLIIRETKTWTIVKSKQIEAVPKKGPIWACRFFNHGHQLLVTPPDDKKSKVWDLSKSLEELQKTVKK